MYEDRKERFKVMDRFIKLQNQDSLHVAIRMFTSMEFQEIAIGPEEFWTRFEKYLSEKESLQPTLPLTLMDKTIEFIDKDIKEKLDNGFNV